MDQDNAAINLHVIFDNNLRPEAIRREFLNKLKVRYKEEKHDFSEEWIA